jgi:hypothetical protein
MPPDELSELLPASPRFSSSSNKGLSRGDRCDDECCAWCFFLFLLVVFVLVVVVLVVVVEPNGGLPSGSGRRPVASSDVDGEGDGDDIRKN